MRLSWRNWRKKPLSSLTPKRRRPRSRRGFHPSVEMLEPRLALSATFFVNTLADVIHPADHRLSLRQAVDMANANPGSKIVVTVPGTYKLTNASDNLDGSTALEIKADVTITGGSAGAFKIDGNHTGRVFDISRGNVTMQGITIQNGQAGNGYGGGIAVQGAGGSLTLNTVIVQNNNANISGGGVFVASGNNVSVKATTFTANQASFSGGAIADEGPSLTISDSVFTRNQTGGFGGAVYFHDEGSQLTSTLSITDTLFSRNKAQWGGGVEQIAPQNAALGAKAATTVTRTTFSDNAADVGGGGLCVVEATGAQGGNVVPVNLSVNGSTFARNTALVGGGIDCVDVDTVSVDGSSLTDNKAAGFGGGLAVDDSNLTVASRRVSVKNTTVLRNVGQGGGGISVRFAVNVAVLRSTISNNTATGDDGGGLFIELSSFWAADRTLSIDQTTVAGNSAGLNGGGLALFLDVANANISRSTFSGNAAAHDGGGMSLFGVGNATLASDTIVDNAATESGGGVFLTGGTEFQLEFHAIALNLVFDTIALNRAEFGGGVSNNYSTVTVLDTVIATNKTANPGNGPDVDGDFLDSGFNLIGISNGSYGFTTSTLVGTSDSPLNPKLGPLANNGGPTKTMALRFGSRAVRAGTPVAGVTTDQRGVARHATPSIGAYESPF